MAKKRLDVVAITNELQHSAFFPTTVPPAAQVAHPSAQADLTFPDEAASTAPAPPPAPDIPITEHSHTEHPQTDVLRPTQPLERADSRGKRPATPQEESHLTSNHASNDASYHASTLARDHERTHRDPPHAEAPAVPNSAPEADMVEAIRKRVRQIGKEISFVRLTPEEKRQLVDMTYALKSQGFKTSENEISRIGINWLLDDYRVHGPESVLARVLAALNA